MKNRRIFYIDPQGGSGNLGMYDYELLSRMKNKHITFFGSESYDYLQLNNVNCKLWFKYGKITNSVSKGLSYILTMFRIFFNILLQRPSVVHIQWIRLPIFDIFYYKLLRNVLNIKLVYTVHNILPHIRHKHDTEYYGKMYRLCDALMAHTETTKKQLVEGFKIGPDKIFIAPHGPLKYIHDTKELTMTIEGLKQSYNLHNKTIYLLIGFQSEYKGTDLLIDAWRRSPILSESHESVLVIAGIDTDKFIPNGINGNIICISKKLSDLEFDSWIKISDVLVFPYRRIEQSGVLLTVVSEHKPYCATPVGELTIPIQEDRVGWIIPNVTIESVQNTLENIDAQKDKISEIANNDKAWHRVCVKYDWGKSAHVTECVYDSLIDRII